MHRILLLQAACWACSIALLVTPSPSVGVGRSTRVDPGQHAVRPIDGGFCADNPGQSWSTRFLARGAVTSPEAGGWRWGLELARYGYAGAERAVAATPALEVRDGRVNYR